MNRRLSIKNPAIFAIISFVAIIGVSFMLVFSAVASSNAAAKEVEDATAAAKEAAASETETTTEVQTSAAQTENTAVAAVPASMEIVEDDAEAVEAADSDYSVVYLLDQVNFRSTPDSSDSDNIIFVLPAGSVHELIESDSDGWTLIYVDGFGQGYVSSDYVALQENGEVTSETEVRASAAGMDVDDYEDEVMLLEDDYDYSEDDYDDDDEDFYDEADTEDDWDDEDSYWDEDYDESAGWYDDEDYDDDDEDWTEENYEEYSDPYYSLRLEIANYASSFAGWLPYVWGSQSLSYGADCSGFTSAIYSVFGYSISAASDVQSYQGYSVPYSEALPGDILVYPGHVAMYLGNGLMIHEPHEGAVATICEVATNGMTLLDVRRMIG